MKVITISVELVIDDNLCQMTNGVYDKECIADFLNTRLYGDPEFFGDFGPENIVEVKEVE